MDRPGAFSQLHGMTDTESREAIAARLKATRLALGLSQVELCKRADVATNTYNQWEKDAQRISIDGALNLCRAFRITLDWIYRGDASGLPFDLASALTVNVNHAS